MNDDKRNELLRRIPAVATLLETGTARQWLATHPRALVADAIRAAVDTARDAVTRGDTGRVDEAAILEAAGAALSDRTTPRIRAAVNATGIILHTGLGRAVWPDAATDAVARDLRGYVTLAFSPETGRREERDRRIEYIIRELTGAAAGMVVNNNAAATLLVLAAVCGGGEGVVSRGQLIEIGGSFRLPDVMRLGGVRLVEVGTTNRTHLKDYTGAIGENTRAIIRVHPSNYRVVGFSGQPALDELVALARERGIPFIDDLGAGALVDLGDYALPSEPTIQQSVAAGADLVLASTDKLIGGPQGGLIAGTQDLVDRCRRHPLYRALRPDKACLAALERTLMLFREPTRLPETHPLYRVLAESPDTVRARAETLAAAIAETAPAAAATVVASAAYLGSGSLPMEKLPGYGVTIDIDGLEAGALGRRLRGDDAQIFGRIEDGALILDCRTIADGQVDTIAAAVGRIAGGGAA